MAAFITVAELGNLLGRDLSTDTAGTAVVEAACDICRDVAEQTFTRGTTTQVFDGPGTDALLLPELPVNSIGTVSVSDSSNPPTWTVAGTADYALNGNGVLYATDTAGTSLFGTVWPKGRQNVRITYDHGYTAVPESVKAVAKSVASRLLVQGPAISEAIGDVNVRYAGEATALMPTERLILTKYRRTK